MQWVLKALFLEWAVVLCKEYSILRTSVFLYWGLTSGQVSLEFYFPPCFLPEWFLMQIFCCFGTFASNWIILSAKKSDLLCTFAGLLFKKVVLLEIIHVELLQVNMWLQKWFDYIWRSSHCRDLKRQKILVLWLVANPQKQCLVVCCFCLWVLSEAE